MPTITGPFDVALEPATMRDSLADSPLARMGLAKRFEGPLDARSVGEMLGFRTPTDGSAGYVAIEWVTGTLEGRRGSFALQHSSTMDRGVPTQDVHVIPDSGTDGLTGLTGSMLIHIDDGAHRYEFTYSLQGR